METIYKDYSDRTKIIFEHSLDINGCNYLVIYGRHVNGGFIAIPNWNICTEAGDGVFYNTEKLEASGLDQNTAVTIAQHISDELKNTK